HFPQRRPALLQRQFQRRCRPLPLPPLAQHQPQRVRCDRFAEQVAHAAREAARPSLQPLLNLLDARPRQVVVGVRGNIFIRGVARGARPTPLPAGPPPAGRGRGARGSPSRPPRRPPPRAGAPPSPPPAPAARRARPPPPPQRPPPASRRA